MLQHPDSDDDENSIQHETSSGNENEEEAMNVLDDEAWDIVDESLRAMFDAWNGSPLCGSEQSIYTIIRIYLGRL